MLSGGETSRVILAFTLALAEIHNSPLILLDESTASLDQDLTSSVITGLKENFSNKLVVLIAHQVVQGVFDTVIKL
jgi:ABC-type transport system involved in cytochrome bd biosynthesis fused ATPase/permease subunit